MAGPSDSRFVVRPGPALEGVVPINGAKNSALKLMAATVLAEGDHVLRNVPRIVDVAIMGELLTSMGLTVAWASEPNVLRITCGADVTPEAPYELVERMRASIVVLGPLLSRFGRAKVSVPGGDDLGGRPIDMHLKGLEAMGVVFEHRHGDIEARVDSGGRLRGARVLLEFPSVGATENLLMAGVLAEGTTVIDNAAREPEIADLAAFLNRMGGRIIGAGSSTIEVEGVERLEPVEHTVVPDRIEAATYLCAVGLAGGEVTLTGARADHMAILVQKLGDMGMRISPTSDGIWAHAKGRLTALDISTLPYPGVPTDVKPFLVALLAVSEGVGIVTENLYADRFRYVPELVRMGADIRAEGHHAVVRGVPRLSGARVKAPDIRAGAALVIAGLAADGVTEVAGGGHIDRGYEDFAGRLRSLGADVTVVADTD